MLALVYYFDCEDHSFDYYWSHYLWSLFVYLP